MSKLISYSYQLVCLWSRGKGYPALVTSWLDSAARVRLYSVVLILERFGMLTGEPLLQSMLSLTSRLSPALKGLPFMVSAASRAVRSESCHPVH